MYRSRFHRALWFLIAATSVSCGASLRPIPPEQPVSVGPDRAVVIVGLRTGQHVRSAEFVRTDDGLTSLFLDETTESGEIQVFVAPPGKYCLATLKTVGLTYHYGSRDGAACFPAFAGQVFYVGHITSRPSPEGTHFGFIRDAGALCEQLRAHYPDLLEHLPRPLRCTPTAR